MRDKEIEIKVKVQHADLLEEFLKKNGRYTGENYQKDDYYTPSHRDFMARNPVEEWFRIRTEQTATVTYKLWHFDETGRSNHADEYETSIGDVASFKKILDALNFRFVVTVEKTRKTWRYQDYEVAVDSVVNLGDFVEVEYKGNEATDPKQIVEEMVRFLKSVGCTQIRRSFSGYPFALLHPKEQEFEAV
jgi:adenylate cyclase, class 2